MNNLTKRTKITILLLSIFSLFVESCNNNDDECYSKMFPLPQDRYIVAGAGTNDSNDYYYYSGEYNRKESYGIMNKEYAIFYHNTLGWSIIEGGLINGTILYYSNNHENTPPVDSINTWQVQDGLPPGPTVIKDVYFLLLPHKCGF